MANEEENLEVLVQYLSIRCSNSNSSKQQQRQAWQGALLTHQYLQLQLGDMSYQQEEFVGEVTLFISSSRKVNPGSFGYLRMKHFCLSVLS